MGQTAGCSACKIFLSTLSLRRATSDCWTCSRCGQDFYPRSPCGERPGDGRAGRNDQRISIHALLAESDAGAGIVGNTDVNFYPRSPCGERLEEVEKLSRVTVISIHALLAESDPKARVLIRKAGPISIHALLAESDLDRV